MKYQNASAILPPELLRRVQEHVDGAALYIPRRPEKKRPWGAGTPTREELSARNREIEARHLAGESIASLSGAFHLTEKSVSRILSSLREDTIVLQKVSSMKIETKRLLITSFRRDMADAVHRNSLDEDNRRFVPDEVFETPEEAQDTVEFLIRQYGGTEGPFVYPVLLKTGENIGYVQLVSIAEGWELGYHIAKEYTGNGYATEAVKAFLPVIAKEKHLLQIFGICLAENAASARVMEKCGFTRVFQGLDLYQGEKREIIKNVWMPKWKTNKIAIASYKDAQIDELLPLYRAVGWTNYTDRPEMLEKAYRNSLCVLGAYDGEKLVGVIRAVGDGASVVFVQDLLVLPEYQRQGVGTRLLRAVLDRYADVYQIELLTDDTSKTTAFYESLGLTRADKLGCCAFLKMKTPF